MKENIKEKVSISVIKVMIDETFKSEAQSVLAENPPIHHHAAQTDRASPSVLFTFNS